MGIKLADIKNSKYLAKDDAGETGFNLTISHVVMEELENDDKTQMKAIVYWQEPDVKPMVCGVTNYSRIAQINGQVPEEADTDSWRGLRINVYNDPFVMFGNRQTGGLRIRHPTDQQNPAERYRQEQPAQEVPGSFEQAMDESDYTVPTQ